MVFFIASDSGMSTGMMCTTTITVLDIRMITRNQVIAEAPVEVGSILKGQCHENCFQIETVG